MSRTRDDAADAVYRELVDAFGEDWSIDDFPPDRDAVPVEAPQQEQRGDLVISHPVQLEISLSILRRLQQRAEEAGASVDELVSEWVTAEASADDTISRDEILALLARRHPRTA
ncbi:hypothetical protein [Nocardia wallacei]|uniref:hypothetical protein n=1 Tax=Nocardia wallacei TaxID=480035 RepID=UPI0024568007|nr:hypothetical protein [Nocardia wallacei]